MYILSKGIPLLGIEVLIPTPSKVCSKNESKTVMQDFAVFVVLPDQYNWGL